jgi:hypothetical protein
MAPETLDTDCAPLRGRHGHGHGHGGSGGGLHWRRGVEGGKSRLGWDVGARDGTVLQIGGGGDRNEEGQGFWFGQRTSQSLPRFWILPLFWFASAIGSWRLTTFS